MASEQREPEVIALLRNREWPYKEPVSSYRNALLAAYDDCRAQLAAAERERDDTRTQLGAVHAALVELASFPDLPAVQYAVEYVGADGSVRPLAIEAHKVRGIIEAIHAHTQTLMPFAKEMLEAKYSMDRQEYLVPELRTQLAAAEEQLDDWRNREAAVCPEDVGFDELISLLRTRAERAELVAEAASTLIECDEMAISDSERYDFYYEALRSAVHTRWVANANTTRDGQGAQ